MNGDDEESNGSIVYDKKLDGSLQPRAKMALQFALDVEA